MQTRAPADYEAAQRAGVLPDNRPSVAEMDRVMASFADTQPSGYINPFFMAVDDAGRSGGQTLMAKIHRAAGLAGMTRVCAYFNLSAEPF